MFLGTCLKETSNEKWCSPYLILIPYLGDNNLKGSFPFYSSSHQLSTAITLSEKEKPFLLNHSAQGLPKVVEKIKPMCWNSSNCLCRFVPMSSQWRSSWRLNKSLVTTEKKPLTSTLWKRRFRMYWIRKNECCLLFFIDLIKRMYFK